MTINNFTSERIWNAVFQCCQTTEPPLGLLVTLLAEIRHWCDRHDESYDALDYAGHELYVADLATMSRRQS